MLFFCLVPAKESAVPDKEALLEEYMAQIAKGDHDALAALYQHTNASIYGFALSILKNASDAEDALHDCFLDIYQAAGSYRPQGKPMAWIFTIVRNRMYLLHLFQNIGFHIFQFAGFPGTLCFFLGNRIDNLEIQCFPRHTAAALFFIEMVFPLCFCSILEFIRI